jgi:hypothetical protein
MPPGEFGRSGECGEFGEIGGRSAKLELHLVNTQRFDAMVKRGWRNAKSRRGPGSPRDTTPGCSERRFDELPFGAGFAWGRRR